MGAEHQLQVASACSESSGSGTGSARLPVCGMSPCSCGSTWCSSHWGVWSFCLNLLREGEGHFWRNHILLTQERVGRGVNFRKINNNLKFFIWFLTQLRNSCCQFASIISYARTALRCESGHWDSLAVLPVAWRAHRAEVTRQCTPEWAQWDSLSPWAFLSLLWCRQNGWVFGGPAPCPGWPESWKAVPSDWNPSGLPWLMPGVGLALYCPAEFIELLDTWLPEVLRPSGSLTERPSSLRGLSQQEAPWAQYIKKLFFNRDPLVTVCRLVEVFEYLKAFCLRFCIWSWPTVQKANSGHIFFQLTFLSSDSWSYLISTDLNDHFQKARLGKSHHSAKWRRWGMSDRRYHW